MSEITYNAEERRIYDKPQEDRKALQAGKACIAYKAAKEACLTIKDRYTTAQLRQSYLEHGFYERQPVGWANDKGAVGGG